MSWGSLGGGRERPREQALPERGGGKQNGLSLCHSPSESGRVRPPPPAPGVGWGGGGQRLLTSPCVPGQAWAVPTAAGMEGLPQLGSLCPFTPVPGPMAELQPGSRPFRVSVQEQLQSAGEWQAGWDTLQGHFRREAGAVAATDLPLTRGKPCLRIKHLMFLH